jgi:hypothetical protein
MSMSQGTRSRLVRRDVEELQTPQFYFAPGDTNVFTGPKWRRRFIEESLESLVDASFSLAAEHHPPPPEAD